jgi:hypothetical protein
MFKKIFTTFVLALSLTQIAYPLILSAQTEYTVLAPLPGTYKGGNKTDIKTYVEGMFKLLIALSAVFAVFMIVIGGFQYMTTDAIGGKQEGRDRIENSVKGLILVIGAWLILAQIDDRLLTINLDIKAANVPAPSGGALSGPTASSATVAQRISQTCPNCSTTRNDLSYNMSQSYINGLSCTTCAPIANTIPFNGNSNTNVLPDTNNKLVTMQGNLPANISWRVSEAYPPVVQHANGCHSRGTCVDVSFGSTPATGTNVNAVISSANNSGLRAIYEVKDSNSKNQLVSSGVPASSVMVVPTINSNHFSVYNCSADPQSCANLP